MGHRSHLIAGNGQHGKLTPDWKLKRDHLAWLDSQSYQIRCHPACCLIQFPVGITVTTVVDHIFPFRIRFYRPVPAVQQRFIFPVPLLPVLFLQIRVDLPFLKHNVPPYIRQHAVVPPDSRFYTRKAAAKSETIPSFCRQPFLPVSLVLRLLLCFQFFL